MKALLPSLFLIISLTTNAQTAIGLKAFKYFVSDVTSPQLGNTITGEFVVSAPWTDNELVMFRTGVIYIHHTMQFDTIPSYRVTSTDTETWIDPSQLVQKKFAEFQVVFGADLNFLNFEKYKAYLGTDILVGGYTSDYETISNYNTPQEKTANQPIIGFRIRVGTSYLVNNWLEPFIEAGFCRKRYYGIADLNGKDIGVGVKIWIHGKD